MNRTFAALLSVTTSGLALLIASPASAQTAPDPAPPPPSAAEEQPVVIVTGSRFATRTVADSPVPIDVIGGEQLELSGATETNKILNQLVPSFNFPQPSLTDGTDSTRPATLRGLSPDQTLVLINGKRRHSSALLNLNGSVGRGSSAVDLNQIPPIAIERIEILRDGAASQYGSDAIAGVINLGLSRKEGVSASVTYGAYNTSMSGVNQITGVAVGANGLPVVATAGGTSNDILQLNTTGRDRTVHDGDTLTLATRLGLPIGERGFFVTSLQFRDRDPTNRSGADPRRQYPTVGDPRELTIDRYNHRYGDGKAVDYNAFINAGYELLPDLNAYVFGSYGIRDADGAGFFRRANDARNRDFAASTTTFVPFYPNGFLPLIASKVEDISAAGGVKATVGDWTVDLSLVYGSNQLDYAVEDSFNVSLGGINSPRRFDAGGLSSSQHVVNLDFTRKFNVGFVKSLGLAFGAEYRSENFKIRQGDVASYINGPFSAAPFNAAGGAQVFPGFRPNNRINASRANWSGYVELDTDITDNLTLQLAGRYESYSDFGDTINGKAAARFEPIRGVAFRGSVSTGFRAPSLAQQFFATTSTNNTVINGVAQLIEVGTFPVNDPVARALGSQPLRPEKATNFAGGVALDFIPGLNLTADYYNIEIRDRIVLTENLTGAAVVTQLQANGINNVTSARFFVNGVNTRTQGVDIVGTYRFPDFGLGKFRLTAGFNYNETRITRRAALSIPTLANSVLFGRTESFRLTDGQPRDKINLALDWTLDDLNVTVRTNRFGSVGSAGSGGVTVTNGNVTIPALGTQPGDLTLTPKWITDLQITAKIFKHYELSAGVDNVFDVYPDRTPTVAGFTPNSFFLPYSSLSPFGFNGRFVYVRGTVNF
ncbi:TonB-dependent receptor plug domain-containing protein [Sphingomonas sp. CCH10-B3]|uniref:TonB-dependent receptor plug domain-containing protein n=1 Tax=Sphingomonas sp. CCH10-B3 TaxID=1768757 RepID=UPI00083489EF|nr:TonB-dependent receptor [Sphingomonas sp. CCH10-B3]